MYKSVPFKVGSGVHMPRSTCACCESTKLKMVLEAHVENADTDRSDPHYDDDHGRTAIQHHPSRTGLMSGLCRKHCTLHVYGQFAI